MKKAVAYCRYSSTNQREESIEAQIKVINEYAAREGYEVAEIYADEAESGTVAKNRPRFMQVIKDSRAGLFESVLIYKLDRFARNKLEHVIFEYELEKQNVRLVSVTEKFTDDPEGRLLKSIVIAMNQFYSENLGRDVMRNLIMNAQQGIHTGGVPPLGYRVNALQKLEIDPQTAPAPRLIFQMYADGKGYSAIIEALNAAGYKTQLGKPFGKNSIHDILVNPKYIGVLEYNKRASKTDGKRNNHKNKDDKEIIRIANGCPALIDEDTWNRVRKRIADHKHQPGAAKAKHTYLLTGKIFCGDCGGAVVGDMMTSRKKNTYAYYECNHRQRTKTCSMKRYRADDVDYTVLSVLREEIQNPNAAAILAERINKIATQVGSDNTERELLEKAQEETRRQINNLVDAIKKGCFDPAVSEALEDLRRQQDSQALSIARLKSRRQIKPVTEEQMREYISNRFQFESMTESEAKRLIEDWIEKVVMYNDDTLEIYLRYGFDGGGEESRTPVRRPLRKGFSERIR